jgi:threonyl-tRNA synthetase
MSYTPITSSPHDPDHIDESHNTPLYRMRHSMAHVLAAAVTELFPEAQCGFGPPVEHGFYYDFDFGTTTLEESDLKKIQAKMKKIVKQGHEITRTVMTKEESLARAEAIGQSYKKLQIENLSTKGFDEFSWYELGDFSDLCEGPHVVKSSDLPLEGLKLDRIAGAYWMGNENNKMLTRIYALCFETREELDDFLKRRKLAEDRDHKKLGKELEIFLFDDLVGKGLPLWLPNGSAIRDEVEKYAKEKEFQYGYKTVATPHIAKADLYHKSQHLPAYRESMFPPFIAEGEDGKKEEYFLKPMNCPHHHLMFSSRPRSYRELPLRFAEYGTCYRYEQSGELSGLIRVRCMTMNDAHMYVREDQIRDEFKSVMQMYHEFYETFGLTEYTFRLSIRGEENRDKFKGDAAMWDRAEKILEEVLIEMEIPYYMGEGEAAFYGPKVDIQFKNLMGREETVSTIQVDFLSPDNFDLTYNGQDGTEHRPVIIHRAPLSTHERFLSFLLEYYGGAFPTWMAPVQLCIIPVGEAHMEYARELQSQLHAQGIRLEIDESGNSFNKKIRTNVKRKIPILLIIGDREVEQREVSVRRYGSTDTTVVQRDEFVTSLLEEVRSRKLTTNLLESVL